MSPDPTLKNGTFSSCRNSTAIYKNQRRFFTSVQKHCPQDWRGATYKQEIPSSHLQVGLSAPNNMKAVQDFIQIQTSFHSQPPIHVSSKHCMLALAGYSVWKRIRALARSPSPGPGAPGPSEQMQTGYDLILTQKTRQ